MLGIYYSYVHVHILFIQYILNLSLVELVINTHDHFVQLCTYLYILYTYVCTYYNSSWSFVAHGIQIM